MKSKAKAFGEMKSTYIRLSGFHLAKQDFIAKRFIPPDRVDFIAKAPLLLKSAYRQLLIILALGNSPNLHIVGQLIIHGDEDAVARLFAH